MRREAVGSVRPRKPKTAPLPRVPESALTGPRTLESRLLPALVFLAFATLLVIQAWKVL